jgi:hypothetical protein
VKDLQCGAKSVAGSFQKTFRNVYWSHYLLKLNFFFLLIVFYSGMDASFPEILFILHFMIPAAPQQTVGEAGIEPGTAA